MFGFIKNKKGFSAIETLVGVSVFLLIAISSYQAYTSILDLVKSSRYKILASEIAREQIEIIRNLPYSDVGISGAIPDGVLTGVKTVNKNGIDFTITTTIRNIDDPFDGVLGGTPNDLSPADYKLVEVYVDCATCNNFKPVYFTTTSAPKSLETMSNNGALFIDVIDANGQAVDGASVHIENNSQNPAIVIDDITNSRGSLQIVDAPPGVESYEITVTKDGYSTEKTYISGGVNNPNPIKTHLNVSVGDVTQSTFAIDKVSSINVSTVSETCAPLGSVSFSLDGSKLIGTNPDVLKYSQNLITDASGFKNIDNLEWDSYKFSLNDQNYDLAGSIPLMPVNLTPNSSQDLKLVVTTKSTNNFLVTVKDASTGLALEDAIVSLGDGTSTTTLTTNKGYLYQTDWSGGGGQINYVDVSRYFTSDGNIEASLPVGDLKLKKNFGTYESSGELESSTLDMGVGSTFDKIVWQPQSQPVETGLDSVKFQIASNNDNQTWDFIGPDGTDLSFYTLSDTNINSIHNGDRYFRYKVFLKTDDVDFSPNLAEVAFTFSSSCIPPGQVLFKGILNGTYTLNVSKAGYQNFSNGAIEINSSWSEETVLLSE